MKLYRRPPKKLQIGLKQQSTNCPTGPDFGLGRELDGRLRRLSLCVFAALAAIVVSPGCGSTISSAGKIGFFDHLQR